MADPKAGAQGDTKASGDTTVTQTPEQKAAAEKATTDAAATAATEKAAADAKALAAAEATKAAEAETKRKADAAAAASKAPEKYVLAIPEEATVYLDAADLTELETLARTEGWTNEEAQAVLVAQAATLASRAAAYRAETEAHETYGGEHLAETQRLAALVMDRFAPANDPLGAALRRELVKNGLGNKLTVVSMLARIGKLMAEDRPGLGSQPSASSETDLLTRLYGKEPAKV